MRYRFISFVCLILLIFFRFNFTRPLYKDGDFVKITSKVYSEPIVYDRQQYLTLYGLGVYLPKYPEINYGDRVIVEGVVDDKKLKNPKVQKIEESKNLIHNFRQKVISFYKFSLPEPYSSLIAGIVIGSKNMPQDFWNSLKKTGTAHVVVASGTNVTMLASFLISLLTGYINRRRAVFIAIAGILIYIFLSGFDAPIVRAGIMGSIAFLAQNKGRLVNSWRILIYTAGIMLIIKPVWITDLGFILSFVATFSLMLFQTSINNKMKFIPNLLREGLSTSIAAQIGVAPIIYATFGQFNILSPIINALVLWTIPYIMSIGMVAGILGLIVPLIGRLIIFVIFPMLWWFVEIISIFSF